MIGQVIFEAVKSPMHTPLAFYINVLSCFPKVMIIRYIIWNNLFV